MGALVSELQQQLRLSLAKMTMDVFHDRPRCDRSPVKSFFIVAHTFVLFNIEHPMLGVIRGNGVTMIPTHHLFIKLGHTPGVCAGETDLNRRSPTAAGTREPLVVAFTAAANRNKHNVMASKLDRLSRDAAFTLCGWRATASDASGSNQAEAD
jgi:hypothetical protein